MVVYYTYGIQVLFGGSTYASVVPPHFCYKSFLRSVISDHPELDPALVVEGLILHTR